MNTIRFTLLALVLSACSLGAKSPTDPTTGAMDDGTVTTGPGSESWADDDVNCEATSDCLVGESCLNDVCQPSQCEGGLSSSQAPIGSTFTFFADNEIGIAGRGTYEGNYWIDGYQPQHTTAAWDSSWDMGPTRLLDITGGRFEKGTAATYGVALEGRSALGFTTEDSADIDWVSLTFIPVALDAGDTDADGLDEVVVASPDGELMICDMDTLSCNGVTFVDGVSIIDVAVGDVDADAVHEIAALLEFEGDQYIYVLNLDFEDKNQPESYQKSVTDGHRIDIGDLDGDRAAEIILLKDTNVWPIMAEDDVLEVYTVASSDIDEEMGTLQMLTTLTTEGLTDLEDLEVADSDVDQLGEIFAVDSDGTMAVFDMESGILYERYSKMLDVTEEPFRIALADTDGDSPRATLIDGPTLAKGAPIPSAMIMLPPYDADHSASPSSSFQGASTSVDESFTDTVSLGMQVDLGIEAEFLDLFGVTVSSHVGWRVRQSTGERSRLSVGARFGMSADPEMYGPYHGAVVLYWGCFDTYTYKISDPAGLVDGLDDQNFVLTVPVGGSTSVWSLARYNALAEALGTLPVLEVPYEVGNVDDYPATPERIDGSPIPDEDMVFDELQWYTAPDVGSIAYRSQLSSGEDTSTSWDTSIGTSAGVKVAGVKVGVGVEYGWGSGYTLRMGKAAMFSGKVSAVPDDPNTPEDEYNLYTYRFSPVVYRQWYTNPSGDETPLFVMTYAAER